MNKKDFLFSVSDIEKYIGKKIRPSTWASKNITPTFPVLLSKYYADLIDWENENDPLRLMIFPDRQEETRKDYELNDPIGDLSHSPVPGIIHRYPDRVLLNLTNSCHIHCRFCFRKMLLEKNAANLQKSIEYIKTHTEIWEVIFSGGDPFTLTDEFLSAVLKMLRKIPHLKMIRFHTRTPVAYPKRITEKFCKILRNAAPMTIVIHANHAQELPKQFQKAVQKLKKTGALILSQTVLMKKINNDAKILEKLFRTLVEYGVKPYYLHHLDPVAGTHHFRISVEEGKKIMQKLRGNISGICMPQYVIDTPGGQGKIPVFWFESFEKNGKKYFTAENFLQKKVLYRDHGDRV